MSATSTGCPSCGASEVRWREQRYACNYCGATVVPRLLPGTLCGEPRGCRELAQSLCRRCARPLCDRHNDPHRLYWQAELGLERLVPGWTTGDTRDWFELTRPLPRWPGQAERPCEQAALRQQGELEARVLEALKPLVLAAGGDLREEGCRFESLCSACLAFVEQSISDALQPWAAAWRETAFVERLEALEADLRAARAHVAARLAQPLPAAPAEALAEPWFASLDDGSAPDEWQRCGWEIERRLRLVDRLLPRLR